MDKCRSAWTDRKTENAKQTSHSAISNVGWIPACAGMTESLASVASKMTESLPGRRPQESKYAPSSALCYPCSILGALGELGESKTIRVHQRFQTIAAGGYISGTGSG